MTYLRVLSIAALMLAGPAATAQANSAQDAELCRVMSATMTPRKAEIETMTAERDAAAAEVELTGDVWEDAEVHRLASASHARTADTARAAHDEARKLLSRREQALQATLRQFNSDVAAFNARCAGG